MAAALSILSPAHCLCPLHSFRVVSLRELPCSYRFGYWTTEKREGNSQARGREAQGAYWFSSQAARGRFIQLWCVQSFKKYARFKEFLSGEGAIAGAIPHIYPMGKGMNSNTSNTAPAYPGLLFLCAERCFEPLREESRVRNTRTLHPSCSRVQSMPCPKSNWSVIGMCGSRPNYQRDALDSHGFLKHQLSPIERPVLKWSDLTTRKIVFNFEFFPPRPILRLTGPNEASQQFAFASSAYSSQLQISLLFIPWRDKEG